MGDDLMPGLAELPATVRAFCEANGYQHAILLADGRIAFTNPSIFAGDLCIGWPTEEGGITDRYSYQTLAQAAMALLIWETTGCVDEPYGWIRHRPSDRRRPDGKHTSEYIAP